MKRPLIVDEKKSKKMIQADRYNNLLALMEQKKLRLLQDDEIFLSLKSVQFEYTDAGKLRIFGNYTHIADGLTRAAFCNVNKHLNISHTGFCCQGKRKSSNTRGNVNKSV